MYDKEDFRFEFPDQIPHLCSFVVIFFSEYEKK